MLKGSMKLRLVILQEVAKEIFNYIDKISWVLN